MSFARRLSIPVSNDTLLRAVRKRGSPSFAPPVIIGIDDWAWRRNHRYGTLICDLERRKTIALLPDREPATAEAWLSGQPQIAVVARDRGGGYALAAQKGLPNAVQVADRWHLMENASHAFLDAVRKSMREIRSCGRRRRRSIPPSSPPPRSCNMKGTYAAKKSTPLSLQWPKRARRSRRSCETPATAADSCEKCFAVRDRTSSASAAVRSKPIFPGSTNNGRRASATVPSYGAH